MSHARSAAQPLHAAPGAPLEGLYDPAIVFVAGALMTLGVALVYSASVTVEGSGFAWDHWWDSPLKQGVFALVGFLVMLIAAHVDYHSLAWARPGDGWRSGLLALVSFALLAAVLVPGIGHEAGGARRAMQIPGTAFTFQPAEFAKVVLVIWLAALLTRPARGNDTAAPAALLSDFRRGFLPAVITGGAFVGLTGLEDYGTAALMGLVMLILLAVAGARWSHLGLCFLLAGVAGAGLVILKPHRVARITTWLSDQPDPAGAGYQINQALMTIGSGGWYGRGLGAGIQKYGYLPQDNNDFILAVICEELGVIGGLCVVALFLLFLWRGWHIARRAPDLFGRLLALGLTMTISLQAAMNVGVVTNSIPTKGISLPFVSAGGSGVVFLGAAAGLLAAIGRTPTARST